MAGPKPAALPLGDARLRFTFVMVTGVKRFVKGFVKVLDLFSFLAAYYVIRASTVVVSWVAGQMAFSREKDGSKERRSSQPA
jgi:hypothetical protein